MSSGRAILVLVAATVVWGSTFSMVKGALAATGPLTFLALRFGLATVLVLPALRLGHVTRRDLWLSLPCGATLFAGYALQTAGLATTTPSRSAFITALSVLLVPLLESLGGGCRPTRWQWSGAMVALVGLALLLRPAATPVSLGDALTGGCAIAFALHILTLQRAVRTVGAARVNGIQILCTAVLALPAAGFEGWSLRWTAQLLVAVVVCAGLATVFAFWAMTTVQRVLSGTQTAVVLAFEPVAAAVLSVALGQEALSAALVAGGILVVAGVLLATASRTRSRL